MPVPGYADYQKREFCRDMQCPVQMELDKLEQGCGEYEKTREACRTACRFSTWQFHHWLIEHGYLIVRPEKSEK